MLRFIELCELFFEREKFSMIAPIDKWKKHLEEENELYQIIKEVEEVLLKDGLSEEEIKYELPYEVLKKAFEDVRSFRLLLFAYSTLDENVCDPTENYYKFNPYVLFKPTDGEQ
jgi:hypothetical protein